VALVAVVVAQQALLVAILFSQQLHLQAVAVVERLVA
jgi:hypothetical protein